MFIVYNTRYLKTKAIKETLVLQKTHANYFNVDFEVYRISKVNKTPLLIR